MRTSPVWGRLLAALAALVVALAAGPAWADATAAAGVESAAPAADAVRSRVEVRSFHSAALAMDRSYSVYLPPGYDTPEAQDTRYPVIYLLHGLHGVHGDWFLAEGGAIGRLLDEAIRLGTIRPTIAVSADGDSGYWVNHAPPARDRRYGDYVALDLVGHIDATMRTRPERSARAISGVSMGGYGAASIGLLHPNVFAAAVSLGGALFTEHPTHRRAYRPVWGHPVDKEHWRRTSPIELMKTLDPGSRHPALYIQCGDKDPLGFMALANAAHAILDQRRIRHAFVATPGGTHSWDTWRLVTNDWLGFVERAWRSR